MSQQTLRALSPLHLFILDLLYTAGDKGLPFPEIDKRVKSDFHPNHQPCLHELSEMQGDGTEGSGLIQKLYDLNTGEPLLPQTFALDQRTRATYRDLTIRYQRPMPPSPSSRK